MIPSRPRAHALMASSAAPSGVERKRRFERLCSSFIAHFDGYLDQVTIRHLVARHVMQDAKCFSSCAIPGFEKLAGLVRNQPITVVKIEIVAFHSSLAGKLQRSKYVEMVIVPVQIGVSAKTGAACQTRAFVLLPMVKVLSSHVQAIAVPRRLPRGSHAGIPLSATRPA